MNGTFPQNNMIENQNDNSLHHTQQTFKALVDAIIPRTPILAEEFGKKQLYGAFGSGIDEYIILSLNNYYYIPMARPVAELLDIAARKLVAINGNNKPLNFSIFSGGGMFAALESNDRILALNLLNQPDDNSFDLPLPFKENPGFMHNIASILNRFTLMGYYSEWSGYGCTRLESPSERKLEYFPPGWQQAYYSGPSLGYRAIKANVK